MLIIFDWDGTLHDSTAVIIRCMQRAATDVSLPVLGDETVRQIIGLGLPEAIAGLYPDQSVTVREALRERYVHHFLSDSEAPAPFFSGAEAVLQQLQREGHVLAVATGKSRRGLNRVLAQTGSSGFFQATRCADETRSKPHPLMLQQLLDELRFGVNDAVMVGDTTYDLEMAQAIGMASVAVSYGAHTVAQLERCQPLALIDSLSLLPALLQNLLQD